jgi:hypothetical protein
MQSTTTKRAVVIADCTDLDMNEEQLTLAANSLAPRGPPLRIHRVFSACYQRSHRRPSRDRPAENMSSDVEHVPVIGRPIGLCSAGQTLSQ